MTLRRARVARSRRAAGLVLVAMSVGLGGCTSAPDTTAPDPAASETTPPAAIAWTPCEGESVQGLDCATVPVPVDWSDPEGDQLALAVVRHRASDSDRRIGTLFFNPGGPGGSGVEAVSALGDEFDGWGNGRFDVVGWDPRGTNASAPVACFDSPASLADFWGGVTLPVSDTQSATYADLMIDLAAHCSDRAGDLLPHLSAADTARDLDRLRDLVGDDRLTYVGLSYGTLIGQTYANLFPDRVRAMVLDGVVDAVAFTASAEDRVVSGVASVQEVFDRFVALCDEAGAAGCALAGHDESARDRVDRLLSSARAGEPGAVAYGDVLAAILAALSAPADWSGLAEVLNAAASGDGSGVAAAAAQRSSPEFDEALTVAAAVSCADGPAQRPIDEWPVVLGDLAERSPLAASFQGWWQWAPCAAGWPADAARYTGPWDAATENPVLLIGNRYDPNTGYANAVAAEQRLGDAALLTLDGYGHISVSDPSACIDAARTAYLVDLELPPAGMVCQPDRGPFS